MGGRGNWWEGGGGGVVVSGGGVCVCMCVCEVALIKFLGGLGFADLYDPANLFKLFMIFQVCISMCFFNL